MAAAIVAVLVLLAILAGVLIGAGGGARGRGGGRRPVGGAARPAHRGRRTASAARPVADLRGPVRIVLSGAAGGPVIPKGFLGLSLEFQAVRAYTGADPAHINPVLVTLLRDLTPGQPPVLRIGGDSTDKSYVPAPGVRPPRYVVYRLTRSWLATTSALARATGARMILGLNLAADQPALVAAEARAYRRAFGANAIAAMEIGNESNLFGKIPISATATGPSVRLRPRGYGYPQFRHEFDAMAARVPGVALAGPALAEGPVPGSGSWVRAMPAFVAGHPRLAIFTVHRYPLRNCSVGPRSPQYPTIAHLLAPFATTGLAASLAPWVTIAHSHGRLLRDGEINSVACRGKAGVSDTFASALWVTDALFALAHSGVDGVNLHTLPGASYELFEFHHSDGRWVAFVRPVFYGLQLFSQAAPPGARILATAAHNAGSTLSVWATRAQDGRLRVVLINKSLRHARTVAVSLPSGAGTVATVERLQAPSVTARTGVTLGGRGYGAATATGALGAPVLDSLRARSGVFTLVLPRASAALVTIGG
jgi:hypothetical protein